MKTRRQTRASKTRPPDYVFQFVVVLNETDPLVWRRIQVPAAYSFWDLHVAIQDAMGWHDSHLHEFRLLDASGQLATIGIPTGEEMGGRPPTAGWRVRVADYFERSAYHALPALYVYDFGDDWHHTLVYEGGQRLMPRTKYPRCIAGARRCPPEDCGGVHAYAEFLAAIADPRHPEHRAMLEWVGGTYDPDDFSPAAVAFDDPTKRWKKAFDEFRNEDDGQ